jgi:fermentation-respiration switch protein FrsA (DUF1100 family)
MWRGILIEATRKLRAMGIVFFTFLNLNGCESLINAMAFHPETRDVLSVEQLPAQVEEIFIETEDSVKIQSYFIPNRSSKNILIYFHGNGGNIGHRLDDLLKIGSFGVNVLGVGYRGYGKSEGTPSEKGIYLDGKAALEYTEKKLGFPLQRVIVLGRSIGTTVAVEISQNTNINGLVLVTPLTSGKDQARASGLGLVAFLAGNSFNNLEKVVNISCPILIVHGTRDRLIPFQMGKRLFNRIKGAKQFISIENAGHNDLSTAYEESYWPPIHDFIKKRFSRIVDS